MTFETAVAFVLEQEGGLSNLAGDSGGLTKFGISKNNHPDLDIAGLTQEQAIEIYRMDYWNKLHCNQLPKGLELGLTSHKLIDWAKHWRRGSGRAISDRRPFEIN